MYSFWRGDGRQRQRRPRTPDCFNSAIARAYAGCPSTLITRGRMPPVPDKTKRRNRRTAIKSRFGESRKSIVSPAESTARYRIDRIARRIHGAVQICPGAGNLYICLIHSPGSIGTPEFATKPLIQEGRVMLDPAPDGDVVHCKSALGHHLFQIAVAQRISQVPPHAQHDDDILKMSPSERRWSGPAHAITLPEALETFATDPQFLLRVKNFQSCCRWTKSPERKSQQGRSAA